MKMCRHGQRRTAYLTGWLVVSGAILCGGPAAGDGADDGVFATMRIRCLNRHSGDDVGGGIDLGQLTTVADVHRDFRAWQKVREVVEAGRMPPRMLSHLPPASER